ncbi:MAG: hypothetical protein V1870_00990 [Candidatus Aenigmatarchaeota archaeon]
MPVKQLHKELFNEGIARPSIRLLKPYFSDSPNISLRYIPSLAGDGYEIEMPAITTERIPTNIRPYVDQGIKEVRKEDRVGVYKERDTGVVPAHIDNNPPYAGVTQFNDDYRKGIEAKRMGFSNRLSPKAAKRVAKHEGRHVISEKLLNYADLPRKLVTLIMESYAEYGGMIAAEKLGKYHESAEILKTTPYKSAVEFGRIADRNYVSNHDGKRGYATFIRDIQKNRSMAKTLRHLGQNVRKNKMHFDEKQDFRKGTGTKPLETYYPYHEEYELKKAA